MGAYLVHRYDDFLMHYGVKGMKWGVRKDRVKTGLQQSKQNFGRRLSIARNYTGSRRSNALKAARKKDINSMSNQELQDTINRLNLERNYRSLTRVDYMKGQKYAADALKYEGTYNGVKKSNAVKRGKKVVATAVASRRLVSSTP